MIDNKLKIQRQLLMRYEFSSECSLCMQISICLMLIYENSCFIFGIMAQQCVVYVDFE
jgi:hypothetical protein